MSGLYILESRMLIIL